MAEDKVGHFVMIPQSLLASWYSTVEISLWPLYQGVEDPGDTLLNSAQLSKVSPGYVFMSFI